MAVNDVSLLLQSAQLNLGDELKILNGHFTDLDQIRSSWSFYFEGDNRSCKELEI